MGSIHTPVPVKLIVPMLSSMPEALDRAQEELARHYGALDYISHDLPFAYTDYYTGELGPGILRRFVAFRPLIDPGELAAAKVWTNALEDSLREGGRRVVNLDPGYVCGGKLVLATTKDQAHRIYLGMGIYAEVTLMYRAGAFATLPWTYPDYASPDYHAALCEIRTTYMAQLRAIRTKSASLDNQADI